MCLKAGGRRCYGNRLQKEIGPRCSRHAVNCYGGTLNKMLLRRLEDQF